MRHYLTGRASSGVRISLVTRPTDEQGFMYTLCSKKKANYKRRHFELMVNVVISF